MFSDPRITEGVFRSIDRSINHLRSEKDLTQIELNRLSDQVTKLWEDIRVFKRDFNHFVDEHFTPLQAHIGSCECQGSGTLLVGYRSTGRMEQGIPVYRRWSRFEDPSGEDDSSSESSVPPLESVSEDSEEYFSPPLQGSASEEVGSPSKQEDGGKKSDSENSTGSGGGPWSLFGGRGVGEDRL